MPKRQYTDQERLERALRYNKLIQADMRAIASEDAVVQSYLELTESNLNYTALIIGFIKQRLDTTEQQ